MLGIVLFAIPLSSGTYTFWYAGGASYLTDDPAACANCHPMQETFDDWVRSSHATVATCNDCHVPHSFISKWYTKAENGFMHSLAMTLGDFQNIRARPVSKAVTLDNCIRCHGDMLSHGGGETFSPSDNLDCTHCHSSIGHPH